MPNVWFTADTHFGDADAISYFKRPWLQPGDVIDGVWVSSETREQRALEQTAAIIENWNSLVGYDDLVFHLGDFAYVYNAGQAEDYIKALNGNIYLIQGNHDSNSVINAHGFIKIKKKYRYKIQGMTIYMAHEAEDLPLEKCTGRVVGLHGHSHNTRLPEAGLNVYDVGVDAMGFKPLHVNELHEMFMSDK